MWKSIVGGVLRIFGPPSTEEMVHDWGRHEEELQKAG
jgi:hypothetical protein